MAIDYTTTALLDAVKAYAALPSDQPTFDDDKVLTLMTRQLHDRIAPFVLSCMEEYLIKSVDFTITENTQTTQRFRIPSKATGGKIRVVKTVQDAAEAVLPYLNLVSSQRSRYGYRIENTEIVVQNPAGINNRTLRVWYHWRPSHLCKVEDAALISAIDTATNIVTVSNMPADWVGVGTKYCDLVQATPQFDTLSENQLVTVGSNTLTFPSTLPTALVVGDYVTAYDTTPVPQIPLECTEMLVHATVMTIAGAMGFADSLKIATERYQEAMYDCLQVLSPRVSGQAKVVRTKAMF
jgi:hypothetical protein